MYIHVCAYYIYVYMYIQIYKTRVNVQILVCTYVCIELCEVIEQMLENVSQMQQVFDAIQVFWKPLQPVGITTQTTHGLC